MLYVERIHTYSTILYIILIDCYQFTNKKELKPHNSCDRVMVILPMSEHNTKDLIKGQTLFIHRLGIAERENFYICA